MPDQEKPDGANPPQWEGLREVDRAIAENRLTAYTWKKTWADPWGRAKLITIFVGLAALAIFIVINDFVL